jgi:hypothetical protein
LNGTVSGALAGATPLAIRLAPLRVVATPLSKRMFSETCSTPAGKVIGFKREA